MFKQTSHFRYLALVSHIGLLLWVTLWQLVFREEPSYSLTFIFLLYILPLLLPFPGIVRGKPYTHAWANFIVMIYLIHGLTIMYAEPTERWYALVELVLATTMFIGCSVYARKKGRELGHGLKKLSVVMQEERDKFERG